MPAKAPIYLKPGSGKKGKKCRLRDILSPDMISPPLGDFRHTVHIGRGGQRDAFGDMSFLQGRFELLPGKAAAGLAPHHSSPIGAQSDGQRTGSTSDAYFAETPSPVLKNAISLPAIGGGQALTLPAISSAGAFPHPPPPGEDLPGPAAAAVAVDRERAGRLEDARLRSVQVFADEPAQQAPPGPMQSKPDVLLDLLGKPSEPAAKSVSGATRQKRGDRRAGKPRHFSHAGSISSSYKTNGSLHSDASSDSYESFDGKGSFLCGSHEEEEIYGGDGTGTCHFGLFGHTVALGYEKGLSRFSADYADGDSGVEEGRVCDLDYGFSKEKSVSRDSLVQITGSLLSLELDLGPSILDEVLNIMDKPPAKSRP